MDLNLIFDEMILFLGSYGFIIVIVFGILHPIIDNPWSFFTMSLSITLLGIPLGYSILIISNIVGIILVYLVLKRIDKRTDKYLYNKKVSGKALKWLETTETWRHVIVIGLPLLPTFFLKLAFPFTKLSFKKYFTTVLGSYVFLYSIYSLVYFGALSFLTENIPNYVGVILLLLFAVLIYFSKVIKQKLIGDNEKLLLEDK